MTKEMKTITFDKINDDLWQEAATKSLRGMPFEKLMTHTIEDIELQPIYTKAMYEAIFNDKQNIFHDTIEKNIETSTWTIAQPVYAQSGDAYVQDLKESIARGNEAIFYDAEMKMTLSDANLREIAKLILQYPVYILTENLDADIFKVFDLINEGDRQTVYGLVTHGNLPHGFVNLRRKVIDVREEHAQGADAALELAIALAKVSETVKDYTNFEALQKDLAVYFATDTRFFTEISKYRAFRLLWENFQAAFHVKTIKLPILATTSVRSYTYYDQYTNLLRAGNETFASVLGGVDVFTVHPHARLSNRANPTAQRIARNVQLVLKSETFSGHVIDPSKGSYYIDILTKQLAEKAWTIFQEIEANGGFSQYKALGQLEEKLMKTYKEKIKRLSTDKETLVGTSKYIDLSEPELETSDDTRFAAPFEALRASGKEADLKVILIRFGQLKHYKARADFVRGFLAVAGIEAVESPVFDDLASAKSWLEEESPDYYIICSDLAGAKQLLNEVSILKDHRLEIAGKYKDEDLATLKALGITGMIYSGQNKLEKLRQMIEEAK